MAALSSLVLFTGNGFAASPGQVLNNTEIQNVKNETVKIPEFGSKVLYINYVDPDLAEKSLDTPISVAIKNATEEGLLSIDGYLGMGIVNSKDSWIPNGMIRSGVTDKIKQNEEKGIPFQFAPIFVDQTHALKKNWDLGDCNKVSVLLVVGKDKKIKYIKKISTRDEAVKAGEEIVETMSGELSN